eukprot:TRINITY_DN72399_c0_g1_i1.p2 TRINITY_DN72399_c0_g1~~TRINITY_DN72399_c0_g1_i1.p2  ORF type:complete len:148 (-),score=60.79 TRINITY_DN72399_c0_g1_i1:16-393(-)
MQATQRLASGKPLTTLQQQQMLYAHVHPNAPPPPRQQPVQPKPTAQQQQNKQPGVPPATMHQVATAATVPAKAAAPRPLPQQYPPVGLASYAGSPEYQKLTAQALAYNQAYLQQLAQQQQHAKKK